MYYLIEYNRTTKATQYKEYNDYPAAQSDCMQKEQQYLSNGQNEMEVVVFEANSLEDLKRTHSRYFAQPPTDGNITGPIVATALVGLAVYLLTKK